MARKTLGLIGYGSFGQFMTPHLTPHLDVRASNRSDKSAEAARLGARYVTQTEAAACDVVLLCMPVQNMEVVLQDISGHIRPGALVADVASVKIRPVALMEQYIPAHAEIVGLHPMFGPQSGRDGIRGLKCVLCDVRTTRLAAVETFLAETLGLQVLSMTPERHDHEIAYIQGLTHWISRAVRMMPLPDVAMSTVAYDHFLQIGEILKQDSIALFRTIENENPLAAGVRREFLAALQALEAQLAEGDASVPSTAG